jgi:hypothetical protein
MMPAPRGPMRRWVGQPTTFFSQRSSFPRCGFVSAQTLRRQRRFRFAERDTAVIRDRHCRWFALSSWRWLWLVPALLCGGAGCIDFDQEFSNICERNRDNPICGRATEQSPGEPPKQPPEITFIEQELLQPEGGLFGFIVEARDPQDSRLRFSWTASMGMFTSPPTNTRSTSEILWIAPPCAEKLGLPLIPFITFTVTNGLGLDATSYWGVRLNEGGALSGAEGHVPTSSTWTAAESMEMPRLTHAATQESSVKLLVTGEFSDREFLDSIGAYSLGSNPNSSVRQLVSGASHSLVLRSDGRVWTWGNNGSGQLGDGTTTGRPSPVQVSGLSGVIALAAGDYHTLALRSDGTVWAWGSNGAGQLGDGTTTDRLTPVQVSGLSDVTALAAGANHTLALRNDGTVWAWGDNTYGQLGDGTTTEQLSLVQVPGLSDVTALAAGANHTLALRNDGTVWAWGDNSAGQLGDGTTMGRLSPVQMSGLSDVTALAAGANHTLALTGGQTVRAWGDNYCGQIGNGWSVFHPIPGPVQLP